MAEGQLATKIKIKVLAGNGYTSSREDEIIERHRREFPDLTTEEENLLKGFIDLDNFVLNRKATLSVADLSPLSPITANFNKPMHSFSNHFSTSNKRSRPPEQSNFSMARPPRDGHQPSHNTQRKNFKVEYYDRRLFVKNFTNRQDLEKAFQEFNVENLNVIENKGFAFVTVKTPQDAVDAIRFLNNSKTGKLIVAKAKKTTFVPPAR